MFVPFAYDPQSNLGFLFEHWSEEYGLPARILVIISANDMFINLVVVNGYRIDTFRCSDYQRLLNNI